MIKRIFSGVQPSGNLHIGNYLGAIKNWVKLQDEYDSIFCVVDLHAITVPQNPEELRKKTIEIAKIYLASGIDPEKSTIFVQSHIPEHTELTWILNTIARMADLFKMTQYQEKSGRYILKKKLKGEVIERRVITKEEYDMYMFNKTGAGLFDYPVLMAADILLYDTDLVPVGKDQEQHIELTRKLAERFNKQFGDIFKIPEAYTVEGVKSIMGLDDSTKKMSKSAASEYNYIGILDELKIIEKKIMKAVTDSGTEIKYEDEKPALKNLINIYSAFSGKSPKEIEKEYAGKGYADFKKGLAETIIEGLRPIQENYQKLSDAEVLEILKSGAEKARPLAQKKMEDVKKKVGFIL